MTENTQKQKIQLHRVDKYADLEFVDEGDGKFSFYSENKRLQGWIETRRKRRVKEEDITRVVSAAQEFMRTGVAEGRGRVAPGEAVCDHPVSRLNEACQGIWRKSMTSKVVSVQGEPHRPLVTVDIVLPDGSTFSASAENQKLARIKAAEEAFADLDDADFDDDDGDLWSKLAAEEEDARVGGFGW